MKSLKDRLLEILYTSAWYVECSGYQNEHVSDLQLETLQLEEPDAVVDAIVEAVRETGK